VTPPIPDRQAQLTTLISGSPWLLRVLRTVRDSQLPDAWVGAGLLRDLVWGQLYGYGFDPSTVRDIDVAFFDQANLSREHDDQATALLNTLQPGQPWEAKNQAAVHDWYHHRFGGPPVAPLASVAEAVATWPETATAVAVRVDDHDVLQVLAPHGLQDLLAGVWRRNPARVSLAVSRERLTRHQPQQRWPGVRIVPLK
jgi:uncharacterized protein